MKKVLSILAVILVSILVLQVSVFAGNGPMPTTTRVYDGNEYTVSAYAVFYKYENEIWTEKVIYENETVKNEMPGAYYDKASNTLTINNVNTDMILETNVMGEDFKLNVIGNNSIQQINIWGDEYGGSLIIKGTGTLNVNANKKASYALGVYAEGSRSILKFEDDVRVNLYATEDIGGVAYTTVSNNAIIFNGNVGNVEVVNDGIYYTYTLKGTEFKYTGITKLIKLSKKSFTYNKKVQKPTVKVYDGNGKVISSANYTVSYSNKKSKKIGEYKVTINFKGAYSGSKTLTYQIAPKGTKLSKVKAGKKSLTATWKKQATETTGYQIQYSTSKDFSTGVKTVNITKNKTTSKIIKKLKKNKKYYVRVRTYKKVGSKKIYSGWSSVKSVKIKK